jgi:uncharacterized membrane protein affecting hemolysin expression
VTQPAVPPGGPAATDLRRTATGPSIPLRLRSLQAKFLAVVLPLVLISTVVVFGFFELASRQAAEAQLNAKLQQTVEIQGAVLAESLWNVADEQIKLILAALTTDPDVVAAAVYDERGTLVAVAGETEGMADLPYFADAPIVYDYDGSRMEIGRLELALTDARLAATALERMQLAGGLAAILLVAVMLSTLIANRQTIGRPLELLLASINRSDKTGPRAAVEWRSHDEIGTVVAAFNDMQERQDRYEAELRASRDDLERRVEERTRELAEVTAAARRAESQLADAIESITEGFAIFDAHDHLLVANTRYREIMLGDRDAELPPGAAFLEIVRRAAASGRFPNAVKDVDSWVERQTERHRRTDEPSIQEIAGDRWQRISNRRTEEGGIVAVHSDITELKRISDELLRAKETAEAANEAKTAFLATMSHEIRTPLNGIVGMSRLLGETALDAEQRDFTTTIIQASDTLLAIINELDVGALTASLRAAAKFLSARGRGPWALKVGDGVG